MRPVFTWSLGRRSLELGKRTVVMGILNVTPDSFSDGGLHSAPGEAVAHAMRLFEEGAAIVDIGGESTRPGAKAAMDKPAVNPEEEMRRVLPVIVALKESRPEAIISVDTYKSKVALAAVEAGADIINDVSGLQWDPKMGKTLAGLDCGVVVMHARGKPDEWASLSKVPDMVMLVKRELRERAEAAVTAKIRRDRIVLDPGFGFGKRFEENYPLLRRFNEFHELYFPLMAGVSRKSWIGRALAKGGQNADVTGRLHGTLGAEVAVALQGAHIIRTHDVNASVEALRVADLVAE